MREKKIASQTDKSGDVRQAGLTRGEFLKKAAVAAAGVSGELFPGRVLGANDRIRIGACGSGGRAQYLIKILNKLPGNETVAVCDVYEPRRLQAAALGRPGTEQFVDYRKLLERKDIDAVIVATPNHWHTPMAIDAIRAGKDVYLEKPVSHTIEEGAELVRVVEQSDRIVQCGMQQRSWDHYQLGKHLIDSGRLGKIGYVHCSWHQGGLEQYLSTIADLHKMTIPHGLDWDRFVGPARKQPFNAVRWRFWHRFWDFGEGSITDLGAHAMDVIQWYMDVSAPSTISASGSTFVAKEWETPETVDVYYEYPKDFVAIFSCSTVNNLGHGVIDFRGLKGTLRIDRRHLAFYPEGVPFVPGTFEPKPEVLVVSAASEDQTGVRDHLQNFLDCIRSRKTPNAPARVGHEAARACHLGNLALRRGTKIVWDNHAEKVAD